ncbi:MAG TPA: RhuM family protein [Kofleriaceae bacterium]
MTRKKKPAASLVRSSAAEYLTFVAASGTGGVEAVYADENVWLSQKMMAQLYDVEVPTINYHLKKVFQDSELEEQAVIRNILTTAGDGKTYDTKHYNLAATIAVGYKVNSERAVQFRKWATRVVEEFTIKGFAMDDERLKRGRSWWCTCARRHGRCEVHDRGGVGSRFTSSGPPTSVRAI